MFFYEFDEVDLSIFDMVVPLTIHAQKYANMHYDFLVSKKAIIPSNYCIDLCNNKEAFVEHLEKNDLGVFTPKINGNLSFPYILKKKIGAWGVDTYIIHNSKDELARIKEIHSGNYFRQQFIEGREEYAAHVVISNNTIVFFKALRSIFNEKYFVKGKHYKPVSVTEVDHNHLKSTFRDILVSMGYQGVCCFDYKIVNNNLMIFEVNPRYGGSMNCFVDEALHSYRNAISNA